MFDVRDVDTRDSTLQRRLKRFDELRARTNLMAGALSFRAGRGNLPQPRSPHGRAEGFEGKCTITGSGAADLERHGRSPPVP
ncbi:MAG: hypothetical protein IT382_17420 [Deltaproteobacteria bacterium]|nr:hypothetical protein [Deltaproteobacteria bacterium]